MPDIFRIQPFAVDKKDFGKVYNDHCSRARPGEWIQILDWDARILTTAAYKIMNRAIESNPDISIFGAYTNRSGYLWQVRQDWETTIRIGIDTNDRLGFHNLKAKAMDMKYNRGECNLIPTVAGFFMLFPYEYWQRNPFQETIINEHGRTFDKTFCMEAAEANRCACIKGLYVFHEYRLFSHDHTNRDHLK